ncbi:MAG: hypothetical protein QXL86_00425 [Candidatus Aenigmatarchaeota archaeon]
MQYVLRDRDEVDESFVRKTTKIIENVARKMKLDEDLPVFYISFYKDWEDAKRKLFAGIPLSDFETKIGEWGLASLKSDLEWGYVGHIYLIEKNLKGHDEKALIGLIAHELGHVRKGVDDGYKTFHSQTLIDFYTSSFKPYFSGKNLYLVVYDCLRMPEEYWATKNAVDAGFIEELFKEHEISISFSLTLTKKQSNEELLNIFREIYKKCPHFCLQNTWRILSDYTFRFASICALLTHQKTPEEIKQKIKKLVEETDELQPYTANARKRIREDFTFDPKKYLNEFNIPEIMLSHFLTFTREFANITYLPSVEEQEKHIKEKYEEIKDLVKKYNELINY